MTIELLNAITTVIALVAGTALLMIRLSIRKDMRRMMKKHLRKSH